LPLATLATTSRATSRYFLFDGESNLVGWRNIKTGETKPAQKEELLLAKQRAFSGIHIIDPKFFSLANRQGKFSMVDAYLNLMQQHTIKGFDHSGSLFIDVGKPESVEQAERMFGKE
jgi:NDP-sugar pyrophosphorylase family protein